MKRFTHPKFFFFSLFFILQVHSTLHSEQTIRTADLKNLEPSWQAVIGGNAVSPCIETSYGIAVVSDGRLLSACTESGNVIWQRSIKGRPSQYISSFGDFLYVITDSTKLSLINPSGSTLWTVNCQFQITENPCVGQDGRVFVKGKKSIACYGLDGKRKWKTDTQESGNFPICPLNDDSIILFLKNSKGNQSIANRYTVFGEKLEDITFAGIVSTAVSTPKGILVSLTNGSIGLVTSLEKSADTKWVNGSGNSKGAFKICYSADSDNSVFFFQNGGKTEAVVVKTESGELLNRFQVGNIAPSDFKLARSTKSGFFISGSYTACEFTEDGTIIYIAQLPQAAKWSSMFYSNKNYIILCMSDWSIKAFLMNQTTSGSKTKTKKTAEKISYIASIETDQTSLELGIRPLSNEKMAEISLALKNGNYGTKEKEYLSLLKTEALNYITSYSTQKAFGPDKSNFFADNAVFTQNLLYLMSKTGTREFSTFYAELLSTNIDYSQILSTITYAGECGYDEEGMVLLALENLVTKKLPPSQNLILKSICDATYEICRYMGRPALNRRGKNILSRLMLSQYDKTTQEYARKTLEKMINLEKK